jgi:putative (di)nucleoside polyphosphate hydrolase
MSTTCGIYLYCIPMKKFLLCHATRSRNLWSIPKGLADEGETELEAAARELEEETGIKLSDLKVRAVHKLPPARYKKQNKTLVSFLVLTDTDLSGRKLSCTSYVDGKFPEIDRFEWVDPVTFCGMAHETQVRNMDAISKLLPE